ncbi:MAG: 2,4-diaminopentanoate dehydrogenase [Peptococcaceae bacterium]|nr:2,4-diaminopentanoate dehydrogenase [Peptococcaceae bacterium]
MREITLVNWGLGAMGSGIAKLVSRKRGLVSVGAFDSDPGKWGRNLSEVLGLKGSTDVVIQEPPQFDLGISDVDIVLIATGSYTRQVVQQIEVAVNAGSNVITIAEEMAFPAAQQPELAEYLDKIAKNKGVTILGTGINPGFVLDTLVIALTGTCLDVQKITATRVNDLAPFGPTVMATQGVGVTVQQFRDGLADGSIVGHIGFQASINLIAKSLGWKIDEIRETREPIVSKVRRQTEYATVEPGNVAGCKHTAQGMLHGRVLIELIHPQQVLPQLEGVATGDYIKIAGEPALNLQIQPEIPGGLGTMAMAVNMIPQVIAAKPGLLSMADLPIPAALLGDAREILAMRRG